MLGPAPTDPALASRRHRYAQANIRGGGEFGPSWHQAALKEKRHKAYEDFEAVARDLVVRGVTSHAKLGCQGGSNGGLLVGNMLARSPDLWGAVLCQVPLLDMRRYAELRERGHPPCLHARTHTRASSRHQRASSRAWHGCTCIARMHRYNKLLAGASWMGEYGNPDTDDWSAFLHKYSPYHTLQTDGRLPTPPTLFTTSTRDDRVHPGHARKLAGKMVDLAMPVLSYENIEGGHGGAADNKQYAYVTARVYDFMWTALGGK